MSSNRSIYISDAPIFDPAYDRFGRLWFAKRIAETVCARMDPSSLVIALYGAWGNGKTTVLNFVESELRGLPGVVVLAFNPWRFPTEQSLLHYFFTGLAQSLKSTLASRAEEIGKEVREYGSLVQLLCSGTREVARLENESLAAVDLEGQKRRIGAILSQSTKKVVVLIDDIDRLDESAMQAIFRLVKLTADFENTVYVLAFDAEMVASVVGERFAATRETKLQAGQDFLEKIVQVPLDLPAAPPEALRTFSFEAMNEALSAARVEITEAEASQFVKQFHEGLEIRLKTPRMAKRFGNALAFSLAINKGEVNTAEMMLVEGIRVFYPTAYAAIKRNKEILVGLPTVNGVDHDREERVQRFLSTAVEGLTAGEAFALRQLLGALFPRIVGRTRYGSDWDHEQGKTRRVTSERYFDRYFSYAIPSRDLPDEEIKKFVLSLDQLVGAEAISSVERLITTENVSTLIARLSAMKDNFSPRVAETLALALARSGNLFPDSHGLLLFSQPFAETGIFIRDLLERIPRGARFEVAARIAVEAEPIRLAIEAVRWISSGKDAGLEQRKLQETEDQELWTRLAKRIEALALAQDPSAFLKTTREAALCVNVWADYGNGVLLREYLSQAITANPQNAVSLIGGFLPAASTGDGTVVGDLTRATYDRVTKIIDADTLIRALGRASGELLQNPTYHTDSMRPLLIKIAHQFASLHEAVLAEH